MLRCLEAACRSNEDLKGSGLDSFLPGRKASDRRRVSAQETRRVSAAWNHFITYYPITEKEGAIMTPALFLLWLVLCSRISFDAGMLQIIVIGAIVTALVRLFIWKALGLGLREELLFYPRAGYVILYALMLILEVLKANLTVIRILTRHPDDIHPVIVKFRVPLRDDLARTLLACAITLTPGTITVDTKHDVYTVHCLDAAMAEGLESSAFVRLLTRLDRLTAKYPPKKNAPRKDPEGSEQKEVTGEGGQNP